jgi:hypothetical protein
MISKNTFTKQVSILTNKERGHLNQYPENIYFHKNQTQIYRKSQTYLKATIMRTDHLK